jgi:ABC-type multidrug transport system ATPase subunit/ABC-type multidrug transport system permease subunit
MNDSSSRMHACITCATELRPGAAFCNVCGSPAGAAPPREWIVGSAADCGIVVANPTVSRRHCRIVRSESGYLLEDLGSRNGTFVNGSRVTTPVRVTPSDRITLGQQLVLAWPETPERAHAASEPTVEAARAGRLAGRTSVAVRIGRDPDNDVVLDFPMVSAHHAQIVFEGGNAQIVDLGSTNGIALGSPGKRISRAPLGENDVVYFGSLRIPAARLFGKGDATGAQPSRIALANGEFTIGRDPSCDYVLDFPMISARHLKVVRGEDGIHVEDLGSTNGTFVNGRRVMRPVSIRAGDTISLGSYTLTLTATGELEKRDFRGNMAIEAIGVSFAAGKKRLVEDVSLTIYPSEFVGLMGPSGAGKTTLMMTLNGYTPPTGGRVLVNGQDLYANFSQFSGHLGYVPQNDIMHGELTVRQALYYTARLRLPSDYSNRDIRSRVDAVLEQLGLGAVGDVLIGSAERKGISGGQRKRVNLAMELITDPSVLFLDEPTSGLSSEDTLMVMRLLRALAQDGKTILLTIHQPSLEAYRLMDNLVVVAKDKGSSEPGRLVYYGPAYRDAVDFFNPNGVEGLKPGHEPSPDEVLRGLGKEPSESWGRRFAASEHCRQYVEARKGRRPSSAPEGVQPRVARKFGIGQLLSLVRRSLLIKVKDRVNTAILLVQAPIIAALIVMVFGDKVGAIAADASPERWSEFAGATATTVFLMAISAIWFGCSNAAREIVGEWAIYQRERMVNLKIPSYVLSKFTVLGLFCLFQCAVLLAIVYLGCGLLGDVTLLYAALVLASLVGVGLGLLVSAFAKTSEAAIALVPLILIPMVIAGGMMNPVHKMNSGMYGFAQTMASRWAFEGMLVVESDERTEWTPLTVPGAATAGSRDLAETYFPKDDERLGFSVAAGVLGGMLAVLVVAIMAVLKVRDVH